jgi:signal transduction histidine kinase
MSRIEAHLTEVRLRGDRQWLERAVDNLLTNALRYSPRGGVITVALRLDGAAAVLTVQDQGPGVAEPLRARLFDRFVTDRIEASQTGLGLAIVRTVAEQHGGGARLVDAPADPNHPGACFEMRVAL